ncbi:hypothetical protein SAMN06265827_10577 [Orenia metallireducens]|uniref:Uncharacterized protein n=1 Tax=Orenia metallireducens TaxID=1413210 RepID=A0A285G6L3_9FIRM|nr:hypothetical protein [Orenia metallireducens]SNY19187.1 hypothetical protein SAMN06265827_10577 [Orenia metallireducens]
MSEVIRGLEVTIGDKEMVKFKELKLWRSELPEEVRKELDIFSCYKVEKEIVKKDIVQKLYVPKKELEFYERWKNNAIEGLLKSEENAVLVESIARRHNLISDYRNRLNCR